jgi:hypothetical protein
MNITIPARLNDAIAVPREALEICLPQNLADWGDDGPVAMAWRWALTGDGPMPISGLTWPGGLPSRGDMEFEARVDPDLRYSHRWEEARAAQAILWWLTATLEEGIPDRFRQPAPRVDYNTSGGSTCVAVYA